jgi:hypothetical protein
MERSMIFSYLYFIRWEIKIAAILAMLAICCRDLSLIYFIKNEDP